MDETNLTNSLAGIGVVGAALWAVWERWQRNKVQGANNESNIAVASANETLFNMLTQRLTALEEEVKQLREQLAKERLYTNNLVNAMIVAGLQVPPHN